MNVSLLLDLERLAAPENIEYLSAAPSNKKPPATVSRGAIFNPISGKLPSGGILVNDQTRR
jgi:hypothetical protein